MRTFNQDMNFRQTLIAVAVIGAFNPAYADETAEITQLTKPESSVSIGLGAVSGDSKDRAIFGQYNGMRNHDVFGQIDIDLNKRDDATGTWTTLQGQNLGLDNRELRFTQQKQGDWKYSAEYSELTRNYPRTINTGLIGAGTTTPQVVRLTAPGTGSDLDLKTERKSVSLSADKWITPSLQFEASAKSEDKNGSRLFGRGFNCPSAAAPSPTCTTMANGVNAWALLMLPEPINSTTKQFEAKLNFAGDKLMLTGGYYGSFYTNENGTLTPTVPTSLNNPLGASTTLNAGLRGILQQPIALPPDNQAHQLYLSGNYAFTPTTHANFKYAYTHATQNEDFNSMGLTGAPAGINNLGGVLDTTLAQVGLTARPIPKLSLLANVRYEDKEDKTPIALYNIEGANTFTNGHISNKKIAGKLEASYQLPDSYRGTLGADFESIDRGTFTSTDQVAGLSGLREKTNETGYRAELRRSMGETLNGAISYVSSKRDGSSWLKPNSGATTGVIEQTDAQIFSRTAIFPMMLMDRQRDKLKMSADWYPTERLSIQFVVENGKDTFSAPTTKGLQDSDFNLYNIDASFNLSDAWKITGYLSHGDQMLHIAHSTGYMAALRNLNTSYGIGVVGKPSSRLEIGSDLSYSNDRNVYGQTLDSAASANNIAFLAASGGLPDVTYRQIGLKLYGKYAIEKNADIRFDLIHQRTRFNEWTWANNGTSFAYSDNTTVNHQQNQNVTFIGVAYIYKWQ